MVRQEVLSTGQTAEILGYTSQHVRLLVRTGRLQGDRIGRSWLIPRDAVLDYLARQRNLSLFGDSRRGRPSRGARDR